MIGAPLLSFYDWYADLPVASPQVFGDQTDVPESGDWWDASYLMLWGSNVPVTRTPDAHWMTEARYRGQKVVVCSPDYSDATKFADEWLAPAPGTDGALAMAMGHVVLREFFVERTTPMFADYVKRFTDLPFLVTLEERNGALVPGRFLVAADLGDESENAEYKTVLVDAASGLATVPNGSLGFRYGAEGAGRWNLELGEVDPLLTFYPSDGDRTGPVVPGATRLDQKTAGAVVPGGHAEVTLPRLDAPDGSASVIVRGVPTRIVAGQRVTTVFDLLLASYGVGRLGLPGAWPAGYDDPSSPCTPAWQAEITGVPAPAAERIGREFAQNAVDSGGRSMIIMGAGTNHYFHSDTIYRAFLALTTLTGCQGKNGGGWAHYVGQEKVRPLTGHQQIAMSADWSRPPRQMIGTAYFYLATDQWRYDTFSADIFASPTGQGLLAGKTTADVLAQSARLGWMPSFPTFNWNPLDLGDAICSSGKAPGDFVADELDAGRLRFSCEDPDAAENFPRVLTVWRANLLGSSGKGNEYFLKHLLGAENSVRAEEAPPEARPQDVTWREEVPEGKLDLLLALDFRMTSTTLFADVVLPAATWYEKHDLSSTDMHPFVHAFNPAISPPWQTRTDFDTFAALAQRFSELAAVHLGKRTDVVAWPLAHDTPDEMGMPHGRIRDWRLDGTRPRPGVDFPKLTLVERDYPATAARMAALGPLLDDLGAGVKGISFDVRKSVDYLRARNGAVRGGPADGRPRLDRDTDMCEAILALSGTTNGHLAVQGFRALEQRTGTRLADLAEENEGKQITFADTQARPVPVLTSPEWSGSETGGRRYSPFTINVERLKPWHTLTGRQHFFVEHDWVTELGEQLPVFRPPLNMTRLFDEPGIGSTGELGVTVRYLTPHSKWSIHSEYQDNLFMLALSRGGPTMWLSPDDAAVAAIADNDWIEAVNRNGVVVARAIVSSRMPRGTVYYHHAQERVIDVPLSETSGKRGGIHNSLTRLLMKPTHLAGGHAQMSFGFNYLGPTGNQRDEVTTIRRRSQEVQF
jgi:nitrate reductase alpha subunit